MTPAEGCPDETDPPAGADGPDALRRLARNALASVVSLADRLGDPLLDVGARRAAVVAVRRHCRLVLRYVDRAEAPSPGPAPVRPSSRRHRVLVAEDCPDSRRAVCSFLSHAGMEVTPAENGRVAVDLVRNESFDLVLLDMQMPEVDGYEAARQLRRQGFRGPVIALTGDVRPGDQQACRDAGCDAYLAKPWDPDQLLQALAGHLEASARAAEGVIRTTLRADPTLLQLAGDFARGLPRITADMAAALAAGDRARVARLAHQASGAAGMFGYPDVCRLARQLEDGAKAGEDEAWLDEQVAALTALSRRIVQGLGEGR